MTLDNIERSGQTKQLNIVHIAGNHHYVRYHVRYDSHDEQLAEQLQGEGFNLPAGSVVHGIGELPQDIYPLPPYLEPEDLELLDQDNGYTLDDKLGVYVVVQVDLLALHKSLTDARFSSGGIVIVSQNEPLPLIAGHDTDHIWYKLLGFINPDSNQLITWGGDSSTVHALADLQNPISSS